MEEFESDVVKYIIEMGITPNFEHLLQKFVIITKEENDAWVFMKKDKTKNCLKVISKRQPSIKCFTCFPNSKYYYCLQCFDSQQHLNHKCVICDGQKIFICFISGGKDNTIRIWIYDQEWKCNQVINVGTQKYNFFSLIMNKNEDLIISTTGDRYIQFLIQDQQQQWVYQSKIPFYEWNFDNLCLNNSENLLALTADDKIYILEKDEQNYWLGKQIFKFYAPSLLFLNDDTFIIQRFNTIDILKQGDKGEFETIKSIPIKVGKSCWNKAMAMQYNENMSIILVKSQEYLNIIKTKDNNDFITESYFLESENFIGSMTNDGVFLVICDNSTQTFKVKKTDNGIMQKLNQLQMSI